MKNTLHATLMTIAFIIICSCLAFADDNTAETAAEGDYTLEQVVVVSRHNIRAPLSSNGSVPQDLTPHTWIPWTAASSELTMKGGVEETAMGEYFRKWLDKENLIPENSIPEDEEVRFNARDKQRCRATARYFAAGMLPLADISVEYPSENNGLVDFMSPTLKFYSDEFASDAREQIASLGGSDGFKGIADKSRDAIELIMDTVDMQDSEAYKSGAYGDLLTDGTDVVLEADKEPDVTGVLKTATQVADALILQYYEEQDPLKAAFGHELTQEDWIKIGSVINTYTQMKHGSPLVSLSVTHPLIQEIESELKNENRKFSFLCAHDVTVHGMLSALNVEPYTLPDSVETMTPIGVKILFERWRDKDGEAWYKAELVYRSIDQIREAQMLTLDNPPMSYDLKFKNVAVNEDGMIREADFIGMIDNTVDAFDEMVRKYSSAETEASEEITGVAAEEITEVVPEEMTEAASEFDIAA